MNVEKLIVDHMETDLGVANPFHRRAQQFRKIDLYGIKNYVELILELACGKMPQDPE